MVNINVRNFQIDIFKIDYFTEQSDGTLKCELCHVTPSNILSDVPLCMSIKFQVFLMNGTGWTKSFNL